MSTWLPWVAYGLALVGLVPWLALGLALVALGLTIAREVWDRRARLCLRAYWARAEDVQPDRDETVTGTVTASDSTVTDRSVLRSTTKSWNGWERYRNGL